MNSLQKDDQQTPGDSADFGTQEDTNLNATSNSRLEEDSNPTSETPYNPLKIRLPAMVETRRSGRNHNRLTSGSEYSPPPDEVPMIEERSNRRSLWSSHPPVEGGRCRRRATLSRQGEEEFVPEKDSEEEEDEAQPRRLRNTRSRSTGNLPGFIASEDDQADLLDDSPNQKRRLRSSRTATAPKQPAQSSNVRRSGRNNKKTKEEEADWNDDGEHSSHGTADAEGSSDDEMETDLHELGNPPEPSPEPEDDNDGKPYGLRVLNWRWMGMNNDDSDSDNPTRTPRKQPFAAAGGMNPFGSGAMPAGGMLPGDLVSGTPSNLGKIGDAALADADPLGVNTNVTFDEVGVWMNVNIHSLKEMTLLPLLPRGLPAIQRHPSARCPIPGPPGTGKTYLLEPSASCRSDGQARNSQPSIIFFDEIDGLAPVRSSKQDQIHASIVSTLLALMDGMDGRGQVIVIGATNRPDAVDPALRPWGSIGSFILDAWKWENWNAQEGEKGAQVRRRVWGADLRVPRYPQVYQSKDRLLLKPETIDVGLRDFMISIKSKFPTSLNALKSCPRLHALISAATTLPPQFEPLLSESLDRSRPRLNAYAHRKKLTALEEADHHHGAVGMGQGYIGAAALHHLEGYHVQSLELGSLMSDSTRTVEAAIVQLFTEAKRHQPSVLYIPSLVGWCAAVNETTRYRPAMLETLLPTDPILLLAVVDGSFSDLPKDVKAWFGASKDNRKRAEFFEPLIKDVQQILEVLPIAPPLEPRKPSAAELAQQQEADNRIIVTLKFRLGLIHQELKRKYKRFSKRATEEYNFEAGEDGIGYPYAAFGFPAGGPTGDVPSTPNANGITEQTNGVQQAQQQAMMQLPSYDMDSIASPFALQEPVPHPKSFLEDIGKIVHNADAQALYTAAELSLMEFDGPSGWSMQRRQAEEGREKGKGKEKATNQPTVNGVRRSTRQNGPIDLQMTDPVRLERRGRLKRGRSDGSAEEQNGLGDDRNPKRSKRDDIDVEEDELNLGTPHTRGCPSPANHPSLFPNHQIHPQFAQHQQLQTTAVWTVPMAFRISDTRGFDSSLLNPMEPNQPMHPQAGGSPFPSHAPQQPFPHSSTSHISHIPEPLFPPRVQQQPESPQFSQPHLLNPQSGGSDYRSPSPASHLHIWNPMYTPSVGDHYHHHHRPSPLSRQVSLQPQQLHPHQPESHLRHLSPGAVDGRSPAPDVPPRGHPNSSHRMPQWTEWTPVNIHLAPEVKSYHASMIIERSPTPPLPDFHVDEDLLDVLRRRLRDDTEGLNVEQLEQLRATCLGDVWRHRKEWDRDDLVRGLIRHVGDFLEEVQELEEWERE
ncbi:AAA-domain-containing protein [Coprinopsis sp. MPI-PUGE-AT-0042]|nr:AAA-domain-containing protein [Coprinopsis sp. MPI-PUGE-AT-0042]